MNQLAVINASSTPDAEVRAWMDAVELQVQKDFYPVWGIPANLHFVPHGRKAPKGAWWMAVLDDADAAGALGYHDVTSEGLPLGKVFVRPTIESGGKPSVTLSHEVLEILGDPEANRYTQDKDNPLKFFFYETCDAPEADEHGYDVTLPNGTKVTVSDFCLPRYFQPSLSGGAFDFKGRLTSPLPTLLPGGYMGYVENGVFGQVMMPRAGRDVAAERWRARPHDGSRRRRRMTPKRDWIRSTVETV